MMILDFFFERNKRVVQIGTGIALVIAIVLRFFPKHKPWTVLPLLVSALLAIVLTLFVNPSRQNLMARSWVEWQQNLEDTADKCSSSPADKSEKAIDEAENKRDKCLNENLSPLLAVRPRPIQESDVATLASDVMAGQMLLANNTARSALDERFGVREKFLGTGRSEPVGGKDYKDASVRDYMVPNLSERSPNVWVWQPENLSLIRDQKLLDVLHTVSQTNTTPEHPDFTHSWDRLKDRLQPNATRPLLVRFALISAQTHYSRCLGRKKATRVHMNNLSDLAERTVGDAAWSTGWTVPEKLDDPGQKLYIWVYAPTEEDQAVAATWGNVLANFGTWITGEACTDH
jgi:hypothetical protein